MKKTTILAAFALALLSCTPKELDVTVPSYTMKLRATLETEDTRTVLSPDGAGHYQVHWASTDAIVVNGETSNSIEVQSDARCAVFDLPVVNPPYSAVYPASAYTGDYTEADGENAATMKVTLPAVQTYVAEGFDPAAGVMLGTGDTGSGLEFKHAMAYLKVTVSGGSDTDAVKSVRVQANDGLAVSGPFTATFNDSPSLGSGTDTFGTVTLDCGAGVAQGTEMYIAIPARTYSHGINIMVLDVNNHYMVLRSMVSFAAGAGKIYPTAIAFNAQGTYLDAGIYTAADFNAFAGAVNAGDYSAWEDGDGVVNIMADIVFETSPQYISKSFAGTLDGHGFTVSGQSQTTPLFAEIASAGTVRNLKRGGVFSGIANTGDAGTAAIAKFNYGLIQNCENNCTMDEKTFTGACVIAGIAGHNAGTIEDCVNNMDIKYHFDGSTNHTCYGGGIAALASRNTDPGSFIRCVNNGSITITKGNTSAMAFTNLAVGGIVGRVSAGSTSDYSLFDACENHGDIRVYEDRHNSTNYAYCVGGIVGQVTTRQSSNVYVITSATGYYARFNDCVNDGTVDVSSRNSSSLASVQTGARQIYNGGIAGFLMGLSSGYIDVIGCSNTGDILGGGAVHYNGTDCKPNNFSSGLIGAAGCVNVSGGSAKNTFGLTENTLTSTTAYGCASGVIGWAFDDCTISDFASEMTVSTGSVTPLYTGYIGGIASGKTVTVSGACSVSGAAAKSSYGATGTLSGSVTVL